MKRLLPLILAVMLLICTPALAAEEVISFPGSGDWDIPATLCLPEGEGPFPYVVMFHGTGSSRDEAGNGYAMLAPKLAEAGIASIRFDFVGNGESKGDYVNYTLTSGMEDGVKAIEYMKALPQIAGERLGVLGWSQGGTVCMLTAARYEGGEGVKSMVTWAGAVDMSFYEAERYEEAKKNGFAVVPFDWRDPLNFSLEWYEEVRNIKIAEELKAYKGAELAIAGSLDTVVPLADLDTIVAACSGSPVEKLLLEGADHTFCVFTGDLTLYEALAKATVDFFAETL